MNKIAAPDCSAIDHAAMESANAGAKAVLKHHSRSFWIASRFLPADVRDSVHALYAWCRTVDDAVDEALCSGSAELLLNHLEGDLDRMQAGHPGNHPASIWIRPLVVAGSINIAIAKELIAGMRMDLHAFRITNDSDLQKYCYHAAGTVGLMMSGLMGTQNSRSDQHAIALGVAMQLTNIARDVREDAERGRSYLPGITDPLTCDPAAVRSAVASLIASAESQYRIASAGIKYLRWDCRLAIRCASALYREIGREIQRNDYQVLHGRIVVGKLRILWVLILTLCGSMLEMLKNLVTFAFVSIYKPTQEFSMNQSSSPDPMANPSTVGQAKHLAFLGLSLTAIMATALFVMVFMNPKDDVYSKLPLIYAGGSLIFAVLFNRLAARCDTRSKE